jgi:glycosyltransferase involved in cell wall biosynthesis
MRVLMVAPHPVYSPRGTPISVLNRCRGVAALGHDVDLVTYPIGEDVPVRGLRYVRPRVPGVHDVKVGPSPAKLPLDAAVFAKAVSLAVRGRRRYDVLHTHEEAGLIGAVLSRSLGIPHVYDMGNDLAVAAANFGLPSAAIRAAAAAEGVIVRSASVVIAHFPTVAAVARRANPKAAVHVIYNVPFEARPDATEAERLRARLSPGRDPIVLYTGTLEAYQGLPTLLEAAAKLRAGGHAFRLVIVGGRPEQVAELRGQADDLSLDEIVEWVGTVPQERIPAFLAASDVLVSPRASGTNTPLKIFSYLQSGRPIVATRTESHTQVLDDQVAELVDASPDGLAEGIARCLDDGAHATDLGLSAMRLAEERFSERAFINAVAAAYSDIKPRSDSMLRNSRQA